MVLTRPQQFMHMERQLQQGQPVTVRVMVCYKQGAYFFVNDTYEYLDALDGVWVDHIARLPMPVAKRPSLPTGLVCTLDDYLNVFHRSCKEVDPLNHLKDVECGACCGTGRIPWDTDIGTDQECPTCDGKRVLPGRECL